jgi:HSP20 family molecular chaperone IbpA
MLLSWTLPVERRIDENGIESVRPVADVIDAGQEYRVVVEMPGVDKEGLEIEVKDDVLRVRGPADRTGCVGAIAAE